MCDPVVVEYDRKRPGVSSTLLDMGYDSNSTEQYSSEHQPRHHSVWNNQ